LSPLKIDQDGAVVVPCPQGPIIKPEAPGARRRRDTVLVHAPQECVRTDTHPEPTSELRPGLTPERTPHETQGVVEAQCTPPVWGYHPGQALTEDLVCTSRARTEEAAGAQLQLHHDTLPGEIGY
jgi:hypothetical protein